MNRLTALVVTCLLGACNAEVPDPSEVARRQWVDPSPAPPPYHAVSFHFVGSAQHFPRPPYPAIANECSLEGAATVQYRVLPDNRGTDFKVVEWHGSPIFGDAALAFLQQPDLRFQLKSDGPDSTGVWTRFHINFRLGGQRAKPTSRECSGVLNGR